MSALQCVVYLISRNSIASDINLFHFILFKSCKCRIFAQPFLKLKYKILYHAIRKSVYQDYIYQERC